MMHPSHTSHAYTIGVTILFLLLYHMMMMLLLLCAASVSL